MSKITEIILTLCLINFAHCGVSDLVPQLIKDTTKVITSTGIYNNPLFGPPKPSAEVLAMKQFLSEAEAKNGCDPKKLQELRVELFKILADSIKKIEGDESSYVGSIVNKLLAMITPKIIVQPGIEFGRK